MSRTGAKNASRFHGFRLVFAKCDGHGRARSHFPFTYILHRLVQPYFFLMRKSAAFSDLSEQLPQDGSLE